VTKNRGGTDGGVSHVNVIQASVTVLQGLSPAETAVSDSGRLFPDISSTGRQQVINIMLKAMVNSRCFTLIKDRIGSQGFKHRNRLTEDDNSVNEEL